VDVRRELEGLRGLWCEHVLGMDALYVDLVEDALWIRMKLMEHNLADMWGWWRRACGCRNQEFLRGLRGFCVLFLV
jgi:hypothetical protein